MYLLKIERKGMILEGYLAVLEQVLGKPENFVALHAPCFEGNEWAYVKQCIDSTWVSSVGEYVGQFEAKLVEYTDIPYAVAVVNGTAALHIALRLVNVMPQDEVLLPALSFVATANAIAYCGATAHFVEAQSSNLGIDFEKLSEYLEKNTFIQGETCFNKKTKRAIKALIPVHIFGHPVNMSALQGLCKQYHLALVEDAAEALGAFVHGKHVGFYSDVACFSFNGNKIITTGGGGAILTSNADLAARAKHITTTAKRTHAHEFYHDELGYNYRLPNLNAALGCAQLERLGFFLKCKAALARVYKEAFASLPGVRTLEAQEDTQSNYWLNALILEKPNRVFIEQLIEKAAQRKFQLRGLWTPLDSLPMYQHCPKMDLSETYQLFNRVVTLPSSAWLGNKYVEGY